MKKFYTCALMLSVSALSAFAAWDGTATAWTAGDGSEANPFLIENEQQLAYLQQTVTGGETYEGKYFALATDLDMSGKVLNPIGFHDDYMQDNAWKEDSKPFLGTFDGCRHTIKNVTIKLAAPDTDEIGGVGLFALGRKSTVVKNLKLGEKVIVNGSGSPDIGGVMGISYGSTIENCSFGGNIIGGSMETGGIAGAALEGSIVSGCAFVGEMTGNSSTGGIVGYTSGATIKDCMSTGDVNGSDAAYLIGGIVGCAVKSTITSCVVMGPVLGQLGFAFMPGKSPVCADLDQSTAKDCYYVKALTGCDPIAAQSGVKAVTEDELKAADMLAILNGGASEGAWATGANGYPVPAWTLLDPAGIESVGAADVRANVTVIDHTIVVSADNAAVTVFDMAGRMVFSADVDGQVEFAPAAGGVYVVVVRTASAQSVFKLAL